jgi:hypothetical protein
MLVIIVIYIGLAVDLSFSPMRGRRPGPDTGPVSSSTLRPAIDSHAPIVPTGGARLAPLGQESAR